MQQLQSEKSERQPKETPLMFSTDNVIRIVRGLKTQTRRVIKPQPFIRKGVMRWVKGQIDINMDDHSDLAIPFCPYGGVGDQIWVKETFYTFQAGGEAVLYKANLEWEREERPAPADG